MGSAMWKSGAPENPKTPVLALTMDDPSTLRQRREFLRPQGAPRTVFVAPEPLC